MLEIFKVPSNLVDDLLNFYARQNCYKLSELDAVKSEIRQYRGVYILYYHGSNPLYYCVSEANKNGCFLPIYIGKALAGGSRKGSTSGTQNLYSRLGEHKKSIQKGNGLEVNDFMFKVVAMDLDLVSWGEGVLIRHFQPVWNQVIDGFGNHDPGKGRNQQKRSVWDTLHPGREWAEKLPNFDPLDEAVIQVKVETLCNIVIQRLGFS